MAFITKCLPKFKHLTFIQNTIVFPKSFSSNIETENLKLTHLTDEHKGIAVIGLQRAAAKNSFNRPLIADFTAVLGNLLHDADVRVVILRSLVPGVFCAGADLKERATLTAAEVKIYVSTLRGLLTSLEQLPMPVIGAIDGVALGGGLEMALACDIRCAAADAKMGLVETRLAIIPGAGGTQRLPRILSPALAKELIFTARVFTGTEAKEMGICNHAVPQNDSKDAAYHKAIEIAKEILPNGPLGVRMAKKAIDKGIQVDISSGYAIEDACYAQIISTKDRIEGLKAFAEKRKPKYIGE